MSVTSKALNLDNNGRTDQDLMRFYKFHKARLSPFSLATLRRFALFMGRFVDS